MMNLGTLMARSAQLILKEMQTFNEWLASFMIYTLGNYSHYGSLI
jgi:hypothetical protein